MEKTYKICSDLVEDGKYDEAIRIAIESGDEELLAYVDTCILETKSRRMIQNAMDSILDNPIN